MWGNYVLNTYISVLTFSEDSEYHSLSFVIVIYFLSKILNTSYVFYIKECLLVHCFVLFHLIPEVILVACSFITTFR